VIEPQEITRKLQENAAFNGAMIDVQDLTGGKDHYRLVVVSTLFDGMPLLHRHKMIYQSLKEEMKQEIHALTLETLTPAEAEVLGIEVRLPEPVSGE